MTPLAHRVAKELILPVRKRTFRDREAVLPRLLDVHCFEVSSVIEAAMAFAHDIKSILSNPATSFLPAPKTWIEWSATSGRIAWFLEEHEADKQVCYISTVFEDHAKGIFGTSDEAPRGGLLHLIDGLMRPPVINRSAYQVGWGGEHDVIAALLLLINSPRVVGRRQHMPHRGLEKKLTSAFRPQGRFPLHAWTEIKLEVGPPQELYDEPSTEAHLTGARALHFCRAHFRLRCGRLEVVRSHWRGDASLGIRQTRYRLEPTREARA